MTATAVVLAGGKGTRSADPTKAKLAQFVGGRSLMEWHLELLSASEISETIVVSGHLGDQVHELCESLPSRGTEIRVIHEEEQRGTVAALRLAAERSNSDELLVILGDVLMSFSVDDFLDRWRESRCDVAVAVHPSNHPEDSDAVFPSWNGTAQVLAKSVDRDGIPNMSSTGLFAAKTSALMSYADCRDIGSELLKQAALRQDLYVDVNSHYFKDTGTPDRLQGAEKDFETGAFQRRGSILPREAIFLDRDGVINPVKPEIYNPIDFSLNPGVAEAIREANRAGIPVLVITNQPGIAKGLMSFQTHEAIRAQMDQLLIQEGAFVDDYVACPHHPDVGFAGEVVELKVACACRKPEPGMILTLARHHRIDLAGSVMIGDSDRDEGAAKSAGTGFIRVGDTPHMAPSDAIRRAIEVVTC